VVKNRSPQKNKPDPPPDRAANHIEEDFVWSTSEQTRLRTLSLYVIQAIVEKHGGSIQIDLGTDTIHIDVPPENQLACAQEIEEKVGALGL
jgi:hypothetical protein